MKLLDQGKSYLASLNVWKRLKDKEAEAEELRAKLFEANQHVTDMHYWIAKCVETKMSVGDAIGPLHIAIQNDPTIFAENKKTELIYSIETQTLQPTLVYSNIVIPKLQALGMTRARLAKMISYELQSRLTAFIAHEWTAKVMERIYGDDGTGTAQS